MNELSSETSPYLLQHASNPVHWKAWNSRSLAVARETDKLIIVSTGYSACHWCHVMEHESFEDEEVAQTMNRHFISIKVDREERPDIDATYMKAVQLMTGRGGWPMNVVCLPDGRPVWGGTYFRKNEWINSLEYLADLYQTDRNKVLEYAEKLHAGINSISIIGSSDNKKTLSKKLLPPLIKKWKKSFDSEFGGYERAPKFMMPNTYKFLMRYGWQTGDKDIPDHVNLTLTRMAWGGLFDTVGGGFSRYSVDMKWHVPHFEKMLYDNGQLVSLYADAFKLTKDPLYKETVEKTLSFISRELTNNEGGFYSALDADSLNEEGKLEEGAFYVWTEEELKSITGDEFDIFCDVFNIDDFGHWEHGNYVLIRNRPLDVIANKHKIEPERLQSMKEKWESKLFDIREKRSRPRLDDKCLTSWNAIMLKGFCDAFKALSKDEYLKAALANAAFIENKLWSAEGNLFRSYKNGKSSINGYLEDYAHVIAAFISLYEVTLDEKWLQKSRQLADYCFEYFYDDTSGFFRFTSTRDEALIAPHFELEDNVIPASNSVMAENLYRLSIFFGNSGYESTCMKMLEHVIPLIDYPSAFSNWLNVFLDTEGLGNELAICGSGAQKHAAELNKYYLPHVTLAASETSSTLPFLSERFVENATLFYVCENKTCSLPAKNTEEALQQLQIQKPIS
ncbi:MAG TPA: thioredoxin domain-containing protein [Flavobacterium sp.]|jgi:hypothetical protein